MVQHGQASHRTIHVVNLDPACDKFDYSPLADIRDLIQLDDVMEDEQLKFGPNGGLVFCIEYLLQNLEWLHDQLGEDVDDYILFDCPGQIELYTHLKSIRDLVQALQQWDFRVCGVYIIDSQFMVDSSKFISGSLSALSAMVNFEIPHVNVLSKIDLLGKEGRKQMERFLEPDSFDLLGDLDTGPMKWNEKHKNLTSALAHVLEDYSLVRYVPLNIQDEESIEDLLIQIDNTIQYGEDLDVKIKDFDEPDPEENELNDE